MVEENTKNSSESIADKQLSKNVKVGLEKAESTANHPKKRNKIGWIVLAIVLLFFFSNMGYRIYLAATVEEDKKVATSNDPAAPEASTPASGTAQESEPATASNKAAPKTSSPSSSSNSAPASNSTPTTTQPTTSEKEDFIEYFIDITSLNDSNSPRVERWVKNPFNVGYAPNALDSDLETCLDGFIRDFNNASTSAKLAKDRVDADIKIYVVTPEQMIQYGGDDAGRGFAYIYKNDENQVYKSEIFLSNSLPDSQKAKCYLIKHEMMHAMGFPGHSDRFWEGIMAVPTDNRNTENLMSDVDTMAIKMLYSIGLPLKANEEEARAYLNAHYPG